MIHGSVKREIEPWRAFVYSFIFYYSFKTFFLSNLCTQHSARTHNPETKSCTFHQMRQPGAPSHFVHIYGAGTAIRIWSIIAKR